MSNGYGHNENIPEEYKPISMWGYFGYELLFSIPFIGFIILIIQAISARNINVRNFARSYFCFVIVMLIICAVILAIAIPAGLADSF